MLWPHERCEQSPTAAVSTTVAAYYQLDAMVDKDCCKSYECIWATLSLEAVRQRNQQVFRNIILVPGTVVQSEPLRMTVRINP